MIDNGFTIVKTTTTMSAGYEIYLLYCKFEPFVLT